MAEALKDEAKTNGADAAARQGIADAVRSRLTDLHARLGKLETDARGRVYRALSTGNAKLRDLDGKLARVSRDDFTVPAMRKQLEELRSRADAARASALRRVSAMPGQAVHALATGTRAPIQGLAERVAAIAKRFDGVNGANGAETKPAEKAKPGAKQAKS
jgi:hypothetical protein